MKNYDIRFEEQKKAIAIYLSRCAVGEVDSAVKLGTYKVLYDGKVYKFGRDNSIVRTFHADTLVK